MHRWGVLALVAAIGLLLAAVPAEAVLPAGNLLTNPGAEANSGSLSGNDVLTPPGWTVTPTYSPRATAVRYGAPGFPTAAQGATLGGGNNFFAGGPARAGDTDGQSDQVASLNQTIEVPPSAQADVAAGSVQIAVSGCLGGYGNQNDRARILAAGFDGFGAIYGNMSVDGPAAAGRGGVTKLLPVAASRMLDSRIRALIFEISFSRSSGAGTYNDGYADNLSMRLIRPDQSVPPPDCPPAGTRTTTPGTTPTAGKPTGTNTAAGLSRVGKRLRLKGRYALVKLHCGLRDNACKGKLTLRSKGKKLGWTRYSIAASKDKTVKVKLSRKTRKRLRGLSTKRFKKLKIGITATVGKQTTKFSLGASR